MNSKKKDFQLETDFNTLRSLIAVVEEGGFSAAAKRVYRTQPAVSAQIAKLEEQLNTKILERTSRSVSLTPEGEKFLSYARRILELADEAASSFSRSSEKVLLRVGVAEYLAPRHLDSVLTQFRQEHPNCDLSLTLGLGPPLLELMNDGKLDLVIGGPEGKGGVKLWDEPLVWTGMSDYSKHIESEINLIVMPAPCIYRQIGFDALAKAELSWSVSMEANSFEASKASIRAGLGITVLPECAVKDGMIVIEEPMPTLPDSCVMSYTPVHDSHGYTQPFINYLKTSYDESR